MLVYTIAGLLSGLAGIVLSARGQTAQGGMGLQYELQAIAMTVIGGTSLSGGRGSIVGTTLGMIIFGVIISGFTFIKVSAYYQEIIMGIIIISAVVLDVYRQRMRART
jgi:inositol transport system permease protein